MKKIRKQLKSDKGFTLMELCIAMALMGVVATMVLSFVTLSTNETRTTTDASDAETDIELFNIAYDAWIDDFDNTNYTINKSTVNLDADGNIVENIIENEDSEGTDNNDVTEADCLVASDNNGSYYHFYFFNNKIYWETPEQVDETTTVITSNAITTETISKIEMSITSTHNDYNADGTFKEGSTKEGNILITFVITTSKRKYSYVNEYTTTIMRATKVAKTGA